MKITTFVFASLFVSMFSSAFASDNDAKILESSMVKNVYELMQSKNDLSCTKLGAQNINWMCRGVRVATSKLALQRSGCGFALKINCNNETAILNGEVITVKAVDAKGDRKDVAPLELGVVFNNIKVISK